VTPADDGALLTDLYELTMAAAYLADGIADLPATFSLFCRSLPSSRGFLVTAGLDDALTYLEDFRYTPDDLTNLDSMELFPTAFLDRLAGLRFGGAVRAVPEGRAILANEPMLEVDAPLLEAQLVETGLLARITYQTTVASKAVRLRLAAAGRTVSDFGLRSAPGPQAGMRLARAARIAGLSSTSNVLGAHQYGLAASGTMAHSFVLAHPDERSALEAFVRHYGDRSVLLVDTYDAVEGIRLAVEVAARAAAQGTAVAGLRIDSGNLAALSRHARNRLDAAGLGEVKVFVTGGLDELAIERLVSGGAPIDGFGVGASLAVSADAPGLETAYKLVELDGRPVRKLSAGKITWAGAKQVWRRPGGDMLSRRGEPPPHPKAVPLLVEVMTGGRRVASSDNHGLPWDPAAAAGRLDADLDGLPADSLRISDPRPLAALPSPALLSLTTELGEQGR
jgi:nicotinate phosphoribosyltransferase